MKSSAIFKHIFSYLFLVQCSLFVNIVQAQTTLKIGDQVHIQNSYKYKEGGFWEGGFLDTSGAGCEGNWYCVSAAASNNRDHGSGTWQIISAANKPEGSPVMLGDPIHLHNGYKWQAGYLDVRGANCENNLYCVSSSTSKNRHNGTGIWRVISSTNKPAGSPVLVGDPIHLANGYDNWKGGYLDVAGGPCEQNRSCVSTSSLKGNKQGTATWRFLEVGSSAPAGPTQGNPVSSTPLSGGSDQASESFVDVVLADYPMETAKIVLTGFLESHPLTAAFAAMLFPEDDFDYEKIGEIVATKIKKANGEQTHLETVMGDSDALLRDLFDTIETYNDYKDVPQAEDKLLEPIKSVRGQMVGQLGKIYETSIVHGPHPRYRHMAYTKYLILADRILSTDGIILKHLRKNTDPRLANDEFKKLQQDIKKYFHESASIAQQLVLINLSEDISRANQYPEHFTCGKYIWHWLNTKGQIISATAEKPIIAGTALPIPAYQVIGPNGFRQQMQGCGNGYEPTFVTQILSAIKACEKLESTQLVKACNQAGSTDEYAKHMTLDQRKRLLDYYYEPYRMTRVFQAKWSALWWCSSSPDKCTKKSWAEQVALPFCEHHAEDPMKCRPQEEISFVQ